MKTKKLKLISRHQNIPRHLAPGDHFRCVYTDKLGNRTILADHTFEKEWRFNETQIISFEEFNGLKDGYGGIFGWNEDFGGK